jgi:hypothetical protein
MTKKITDLQSIKNKDVQIIEISDSNENKVFVIADKKLNSIFVLFRGTESVKATASWLNLFRDIPTQPCNTSNNKFLTKLDSPIISTDLKKKLIISCTLILCYFIFLCMLVSIALPGYTTFIFKI